VSSTGIPDCPPPGNHPRPRALPSRQTNNEGHIMRGVLLWVIGIPIPIIILLYLFGIF
jgi:hypothetical protein